MSKAFYLPEISEKFIKYEVIPATSHTPQLLASNCFLSEKRDSRVGFEIPNSIFAIWREVEFFGWSQESESMWIILCSLILTIQPWKSTTSQRGIQITFSFSVGFKASVRYFYQIIIFSRNDRPLKTMKNVFYFIKKVLFVLEIFKFL